jgi:hypothetical protein
MPAYTMGSPPGQLQVPMHYAMYYVTAQQVVHVRHHLCLRLSLPQPAPGVARCGGPLSSPRAPSTRGAGTARGELARHAGSWHGTRGAGTARGELARDAGSWPGTRGAGPARGELARHAGAGSARGELARHAGSWLGTRELARHAGSWLGTRELARDAGSWLGTRGAGSARGELAYSSRSPPNPCGAARSCRLSSTNSL